MVLLHVVGRPQYHKNGTQFIGKIFCRIIGESRYEWCRLEKRIFYMRYWYMKQWVLNRLQLQYPQIAQWFSLMNKANTSKGFPALRQYERYQDFAVYNANHEGWFQMYFVVAGTIVLIWNWWVIAVHNPIRGDNVEDQDLHRWKDARITTNFDRTKYKFNYYFFATHYNALTRRSMDAKDHPDDPRLNWVPMFNRANPYGLDRYVKYYGYNTSMRKM